MTLAEGVNAITEQSVEKLTPRIEPDNRYSNMINECPQMLLNLRQCWVGSSSNLRACLINQSRKTQLAATNEALVDDSMTNVDILK